MTPRRVQMTRAKGGWRRDHPDAVIVAPPAGWVAYPPELDVLDGETGRVVLRKGD